MIKLRVEFHHKCPGCGTELVVDYLGEPVCCQVCPWCGSNCETDQNREDGELREYIIKSVKDLEKKANCKTAVRG